MTDTPLHSEGLPAAGGSAKSSPLIILGVTGSIAAYKACEVARGLVKAGCRVKVILTPHASKFVGAPTFHALTGETVETELFSDARNATNHIGLAQEADLMLIVPATANVLAKLAWGVADDLLSTVAVATNAPILVAPAMNPDMYASDTVRANLALLTSRGVRIVEPAMGEVVCGDTGKGKLAEVDEIIAAALETVQRMHDLRGVRAVVTAGPTREPIDSVRFIGNRSSGKMGYAIAQELLDRGAEVVLISGPVELAAPKGARLVSVETALEMRDAVLDTVTSADLFVASAAVADFRAAEPSPHKMHRGDSAAPLELTLVPNPDILAEVGDMCASGALPSSLVLVGFAAEDGRDGDLTLAERGRAKLERKQADLVVVNDISVAGIGFDAEENQVVVVSSTDAREIDRASKREVARAIVGEIRQLIQR